MKHGLEALPTSPRKRIAGVQGLTEKVRVKIDDKIDKFMRSDSVHGEVHTMIRDFYFRSDISYTAPGMIDVWDDAEKKRKLCKHYLTMYLCKASCCVRTDPSKNWVFIVL